MNLRISSKLAVLALVLISIFARGTANAATVALTATTYNVSEAQGEFLVPVKLASILTGTTGSVTVTAVDATALNGVNYNFTSQVVTWNSGDAALKYVPISITDSGIPNGSILKFTVTLSTPTGAVTLGTPVSTSVQILSAHSLTNSTIKLENSSYVKREPVGVLTGTMPFLVDFTRAGDPNLPMSVTFSTMDGTALSTGTSKPNFVAVNGSIALTGTAMVVVTNTNGVFAPALSGTSPVPAGASLVTGTINVPILHDTAAPLATPQFSVFLNSPTGGVVTRFSSIGRILDIDATVPVLEFSSEEYYFTQGQTGAAVTVYRSGTAAGSFTMNSADGTALAGTDYTAVAASLSLVSGTGVGSELVSQPITISATGQTFQPLYFNLSLGVSGTNPLLGAINQATVYIKSVASNQAVMQFDSPTYLVSQAADSIATAQLLVQRSGNLNQTSQVNFLTVPGTAEANIDYQTRFGTLIFAPGEVSKSIDVTINPSSSITGPLTFSVALSSGTTISGTASGTTTLGAYANAVVTIAPNPQQNVVSFVTPSYAINEDSLVSGTLVGATTQIGVQLTRSAADRNQDVTVYAYTRQGTAKEGIDYVAIPQSNPVVIVFNGATNETYKTFTVAAKPDTLPESTETFNVVLRDPVNAVLGVQSSAEVDIHDNDNTGTVQFTVTDYLVNEGDGTVTLGVALVRSGDAPSTVTVPYQLSAGTASADRFNASSGTVTFGPNVSYQQITIPLVDDRIVQPAQTFSVTLLSPPGSGVTLGTNVSASVTLTDNDGDNYVEFESATYGDTEPDGAGHKLVQVRLRATRNGGTNVPLAIDYEITPGTALAGTDYEYDSSVTHTAYFSPGDSVVDISVPILNDGESTGTKEFTLRLKKNITPDGDFTGVGPQANARFRIFEVDVSTTQAQFISPEFSVKEGGPALQIPIIRLGPYLQADSTVYYQTRLASTDPNPNQDTAIPGRDYQGVSGSVVFHPLKDAAGRIYGQETLKFISVPIYDNGLNTGDLRFKVLITSADNIKYGSQMDVIVTIRDAEVGNQVQFAQTDFTALSTDATANVVVTLNPTGNTNITSTIDYIVSGITANNGVDYNAATGTLVFSPADFVGLLPGQFPKKTISIPLVAGALYVDQTKQFSVALVRPSSGVIIRDPANATVTIADGKTLGLPKVAVTVPAASARIPNDGTIPGVFTITRSGALASATNAITVNYELLGTAVPGPTLDGAYDYQRGVLTGSCVIPAGSLSVNIPVVTNKNPNANGDVSLILNLVASTPDPITNRLTYVMGASVTGTITIVDVDQSGLGVTMTADNRYPLVTDQVVYTITVKNQGAAGDAFGVNLTQFLPKGVQFLTSDWPSTMTATTSGTLVNFDLGIIPNSSTFVVKVAVQPTSALTFDSTATVTTTSGDQYQADNAATERIYVRRSVEVPAVSVFGAGDAYELTPLVDTTTKTSYLGSYPGLFTFTRTGDTTLPLQVNYVVSGTAPNPIAQPGSKYAVLTGQIKIPSGSKSASLYVNPFNNGTVDGVQSVAVTVTLPTGDTYTIGGSPSAYINIIDDDVPVIKVKATTPLAWETGPVKGYFTISRNNAPGYALDVACSLGGTAVSGTDFIAYSPPPSATSGTHVLSGSQGIVTIPAGQSSVLVEIRPIANLLIDGQRAVNLTLTPATAPANNGTSIQQPLAYSIASGGGTDIVTIGDKMTAYLSQALADRTATRSTGKMGRMIFNRKGDLTQPVTVNYSLAGLAKYGVDYKLVVKPIKPTIGTTSTAVVTSSLGKFKGKISFAPGVEAVALYVVPIKVTPSLSVASVIVSITGSTAYQFSDTVSKSTVNIYR